MPNNETPPRRSRTFWAALGLGILALGAIIAFASWTLYMSTTPSDEVDLTASSTISVVLTDQGFSPQHVRIKAGTKIVFSTSRHNEFWPASNPHPTHDIYPQLDPKRALDPSETWTFEADRVGLWGYHDHIRSYYTGILDIVP